jgi:hypothetical protein
MSKQWADLLFAFSVFLFVVVALYGVVLFLVLPD